MVAVQSDQRPGALQSFAYFSLFLFFNHSNHGSIKVPQAEATQEAEHF